MTNLRHTTVPSPFGELCVIADDAGLRMVHQLSRSKPPPSSHRDTDALAHVCEQLTAYFAGELRTFDLALDPIGTPFQRSVWALLQEIPYGTTATYAQIARKLDKPAATRAVGAANGANPIPFIIPCHRVIGSNGSLTGYALGLEMKRALLTLEGATPPSTRCGPFAARSLD